MIPRILAIAGSDSGGGAGIQADIKTITMLGGHAMTAVTAITAQNTRGVDGILPVPAEMVLAQIDAVVRDIGVDAIKIGMIGSAEVADAVAERLRRPDLAGVPVVFDPVMVASSGARLSELDTLPHFLRLVERATVSTPNVEELGALAGVAAEGMNEIDDAASRLLHLGPILVTGISLPGGIWHRISDGVRVETPSDWMVEDWLFWLDLSNDSLPGVGRGPGDANAQRPARLDPGLRREGPEGVGGRPLRIGWSDERIATRHDHGTGCTLSSAIATGLAAGLPLEDAIARARAYVRATLLAAPGLGQGHGPMGHGLGQVWF